MVIQQYDKRSREQLNLLQFDRKRKVEPIGYPQIFGICLGGSKQDRDADRRGLSKISPIFRAAACGVESQIANAKASNYMIIMSQSCLLLYMGCILRLLCKNVLLVKVFESV